MTISENRREEGAAALQDNRARAWGMREVDLTVVQRYVEGPGAAAAPTASSALKVLAIVAHAACATLADVPLVNGRWTEAGIIVPRTVGIGIEFYTGNGRLVPVLHDASSLALAAMIDRVTALAARIPGRGLTPADLLGGTFTIGDIGAIGAVVSRPLLHQGQAGILHVCKIRRIPRVIGDAIESRSISNFCFTFDHRVMDGATSSRFQNLLKGRLEKWDPSSISSG